MASDLEASLVAFGFKDVVSALSIILRRIRDSQRMSLDIVCCLQDQLLSNSLKRVG